MEKLRIVVDNRVRLPVNKLTPSLFKQLIESFTYANPEHKKWKFHASSRPKWKQGKPPAQYITTFEIERDLISFPRGAISRVISAVADATEFEISNEMTDGEHGTAGFPKLSVELRPHQKKLVECGIEAKTCLWRSPQGSGKTTALFGLISRVNLWSLVVVPNTNLLDQWLRRAQAEIGVEPGVIGDGSFSVKPLTVGLWQSISKRVEEIAPQFGLVAFDEVQQSAAPALQQVIDAMPARYRVGVSGDERRADGKEFLIYDQFGRVAYEVTRQEVESAGYTVDVELRVIPTDFECDWYRNLKPTKKRDHHHAFLDALTRDPDRNKIVTRLAAECIDVEREQVMVLSERVEHCHELERMIGATYNCGLLVGGKGNRTTFENSLHQFRNRYYQAAVGTYKAVGVGFESHPELARGIFASPAVSSNPKGDKQFRQYMGRYARGAQGKTKGIVYYLWDHKVFGINPLRLLCRWVRNVEVLVGGEWIRGREALKRTEF